MKAGKIIEYLQQFEADKEISMRIDIEVFEPSSFEDTKLSNARLLPEDNSGEPLVFNTRPVKITFID